MKHDPWVEKAIIEIDAGNWFDGFQMFQGALQRAIRQNNSSHAREIISKSIPLFSSGKQTRLVSDIVVNFFIALSRKRDDISWVSVIAYVFEELRKNAEFNVLSDIKNKIINNSKFHSKEFSSNLIETVHMANTNSAVISDLYYCNAGILTSIKEYLDCFELLETWGKEFEHVPPKLRTYLTLAELNAYETQGCGRYLEDQSEDETNETDQMYLEIGSRILRAVKILDEDEFQRINEEYQDLINSDKDALLSVLIKDLKVLFQPQKGAGLFSMFGL